MNTTREQLEYLMEFYQKLKNITAEEGQALFDEENELGIEEDLYSPHAVCHEKIREMSVLIDIKYEETVKEWRKELLKDWIVTGKEDYYFYEQTIFENESPFAATHQLLTKILYSELTPEEKEKQIKLLKKAAEATGKVEVQDCLWNEEK